MLHSKSSFIFWASAVYFEEGFFETFDNISMELLLSFSPPGVYLHNMLSKVDENIKIIFKDLIYFDLMLVSLILVWFFIF